MFIGLLATTDPFQAVKSYLHHWNPALGAFHLGVIAGAAILLWLGVGFIERTRISRQLHAQTPHALFVELCQAHALSRSHRQVLEAAARQVRGEQVCRVFTDRQLLERFGSAHPAEAGHCRELVQRLFGANPE